METESQSLIEVKNLDTGVASQPADMASRDKCGLCTGSKCCRYITQEIDTPRSMRAFDVLLWQISHANVEVFKEDGAWYITVNTVCNHLLPGGRCGIYETRPIICREHSNEHCEFDADPTQGFDLYFDSYLTLDAYCRKRFKTWDQRFNNPNI